MGRTKAEAVAALAEVRRFAEGKLKLLVNEDKTRVSPLGKCEFLGFNVRGKQIRATEKSLRRFKERIREATSRSRGVSMESRLKALKSYCVGWFHYCLMSFAQRVSSLCSSVQNRVLV